MKRFEPSSKNSNFSVLRMKIEKMIEDGFSFIKDNNKSHKSNKKLFYSILSPVA